MDEPKIAANGYVSALSPADRLPEPGEVAICRKFLAQCERTRTGRIGSYGLKHMVERTEGTYVSNGALLQACRDLGIRADQITSGVHRSPNGMVAVSRRSVRRLSGGRS
jgi:hypothetical protein